LPNGCSRQTKGIEVTAKTVQAKKHLSEPTTPELNKLEAEEQPTRENGKRKCIRNGGLET